MAIPSTEEFETFLAGCTVVPEQDGERVIPLYDVAITSDQDGQPPPALGLKYPDTNLKIRSVLDKISQTLIDGDSPSGDQIAVATLALIAETRPPMVGAVDHANRCLSRTHAARLMQSIIWPGRLRADYDLRLGTYCLSRFDAKRYLYWADRGHSAYPVDLRHFASWPAIQRELDVILVDWPTLLHQGPLLTRWGPKVASSFFLDTYYAAIAGEVARRIRTELKRDVLVLEAGAMLSLDIESLLNTLLLKVVSYFVLKRESGVVGWATYSDMRVLHSNFTPDEELKSCEEWLRVELGFTGFSDSRQIDRALQSYCSFLQRAHGHRLKDRFDDAFLHFAIALDLILGAEGRSSESVGQRAATLVHRQAGLPIDQQVRKCKDLYARRSKFVHEGKSVSIEDLRDIDCVCTEVLWALLSVAGTRSIDTTTTWLRKVDFLYHAIIAGESPPETSYAAVGLCPAGMIRKPPLRVDCAEPRML